MPADKKLQAKQVNDKDVPLADIGKSGKKDKHLAQHKDVGALPPLSAGIVNIGKAVAAGGSGAAEGSSNSNADNPKAKGLAQVDKDDIAKGDSDHANKIHEVVKAHVDEQLKDA